MPIKWTKANYRIIGRLPDVVSGGTYIGAKVVNGYVCAVDLHDSNRPWPIGSHKNGKLWTLTDLISGLKVQDFVKRPTADDIEFCMPTVLKYWQRCSEKAENGEVLTYTPEQKAYAELCPFPPSLNMIEPVAFCSAWYSYPEFACMQLRRGWDTEGVGK